MRRWLAKRETSELPSPDLPDTDPLDPLLPLLPLPVAKVAASGIPALGTRTRWTLALIEALSELEPPERVRVLVRYWLTHRDHQSVDLAVAHHRALRHAESQLDSFYKSHPGVPTRFWIHVEAVVRAQHAQHPGLPPVDGLVKTAFAVMKIFYQLKTAKTAIGYRFFETFTGKNTAKSVRNFFKACGWLQPGMYIPGRHSRFYTLASDLWPPLPEEPVLYTPT
jgi:hypothetical protein